MQINAAGKPVVTLGDLVLYTIELQDLLATCAIYHDKLIEAVKQQESKDSDESK